MKTITVNASRQYHIHIGTDLISSLGAKPGSWEKRKKSALSATPLFGPFMELPPRALWKRPAFR